MNRKELDIVPFWVRMNELLKEQKKTQIELCGACGFSLGGLRTRIFKNSVPSVFDAFLIADFLNVSIEYLLLGDSVVNVSSSALNKLQDKISRIEKICKE